MTKPLFRYFAFLLLAILTLPSARAQQVPGLHLSNYGGLYRTTYNPSTLGGSRYRWQVNFTTLGSTINNRYFIFLGRNSLFYPLLAPHSTDELYGRSRTMGSITQQDPVHLVSDIRWPSAMVSIGKRHGVAFQLRSRGYVQGTNIPEGIRTLYFRRLDTPATPVQEGIWGDFNLLQQSFSEASFSYGLMLLDLPSHKLRVGGTAKKIFGARAAYLRGSVDSYEIQATGTTEDEKELALNGFTYESGYSHPNQPLQLNNLFDANQYAQGWGYDLGASYELGSYWTNRGNNKKRTEKFTDGRPGYLVRLSASLTDLGSIRYGTTNSRVISGQQSRSVIGQRALETIADRGPEGFASLFPAQSTTALAGKVSLPSAVHLEADVQLLKAFFVNVARTRHYGQPDSPLAVMQPSIMTITPRFEGEDSDFAFPISFIEGNGKASIGFLARFGPAHVGFSNFNGLIGKGATRGSFVYLGLSAWNFRKQ
ncbi:DUF5723 family protein [Telluribacter sp. SYSU D00476]|uniref:DUF5723 family protein n=1 Tax=Telluribacter sp. SYSU D00476 TaxID=2811430 RepID=UPI001FF5A415|nr:DUF5723 family protein [Telluribacter sp. SYSU D00476]